MLREYLSSKELSIYRLSKDSKVPYSTVNDLVNYKLPVENMRSGQLRALADTLELTMNELYDLCQTDYSIYSEKFNIIGHVLVKHKTYYIHFEKDGNLWEEEVLPVKAEATRFIKYLALWRMEEILQEHALEAVYETLCAQTKK